MTNANSNAVTATNDPWPQQRVSSIASTAELIRLLDRTLADAGDEVPMQVFLAAHPALLTCLLPPGRDAWCWDRPRFGAELIPDFLLCTRNSTGFEWVLVELEGPAEPQLTQAGLPARKLNQAMGQVRDWRSWLRRNIAYAQGELGFQGISAECQAVIVIGRRSSLDPKNALKWRELSDETTRIMTYDRLVEACSAGRSLEGGPRE